MRVPNRVIAALGLAVGCGGSIFNPGEPDGGSAAASGAAGTKADAGTGAAGGVGGAGGTSGGAAGNPGGSGGAGGSSTGGGGAGRGGAAGTGSGGKSGSGGNSGAGGNSASGGASGAGGNTAGGTSGAGGSGTAGSGGGAGTGGSGTGGFDAGGSGGGAGTGGSGTGGSGTNDSGIDWGACTSPGTCVAVRKGCCDPCGMPELDSFAGVNAAHVDVFKAETCPVPIPCPKCPTMLNPNIAARCVNSRCEAFDVRRVPEYSACAFDSDCRLRGGLTCCERCSSDAPWVAINVSSEPALKGALCNGPVACPPCIPVPPAGMRPVCTTGHCAVEPPCSLAPRIGCCFSDPNCTSGQCYGATCAIGSEGMCKTRANQNECWGDRDCDPGKSCKGFQICACGLTCLTPDKPGVCG